MMRGLAVVGVFLLLGYLKWRLSPPKDVLGSYLDLTKDRTRTLIRLSQDQTDDMGGYLGV